ncbi:hypothetical protein [Methylobacterium nigriterrae]|uniref:hypothetical protein n=1 Tax=Methylobacterium nigriterrae TaxID=3127512 RepID=UPI0030137FDD
MRRLVFSVIALAFVAPAQAQSAKTATNTMKGSTHDQAWQAKAARQLERLQREVDEKRAENRQDEEEHGGRQTERQDR